MDVHSGLLPLLNNTTCGKEDPCVSTMLKHNYNLWTMTLNKLHSILQLDRNHIWHGWNYLDLRSHKSLYTKTNESHNTFYKTLDGHYCTIISQ